MWQYGSNVYGLNGDVDLLNIISSGDVKNNTPVTPTVSKTEVEAETVQSNVITDEKLKKFFKKVVKFK